MLKHAYRCSPSAQCPRCMLWLCSCVSTRLSLACSVCEWCFWRSEGGSRWAAVELISQYQGSASTAAFPPAPNPSSQLPELLSGAAAAPPGRALSRSPSSARVALKACAWRSGNMLSYAGWRVHFTPAAGLFARDYSGCVSSFLFVCAIFTGRF